MRIRSLVPVGALAGAVLAACHPAGGAAGTAPRPARLAPGPVPFGAPLPAAQQRWVDSTLETLSLRERAAQLVMVWVLGDYASADDSSAARAAQWVARDGVGGIVMSLGSPIEVAAKVNWLQAQARVPLLVGSDVEPGLGRLEGGVFTPQLWSAGAATVLPSNMAIGATGSEALARAAGRITGLESRASGIHVAFAPTADVNNNPANPVINTRAFGERPADVARLTAAFIRGVQEAGVAATAKHFPGHGDTDVDSHLGLPVLGIDRRRLDTLELAPFRAAIGAGVAAIMTAHIALPAITGDSVPATLSPFLNGTLLRDSLGFGGVTFTDALTMDGVARGYGIEESAVRAVLAGDDVLLMPADVTRAIDAVVAAVAAGRIPRERLDRSVRRVLELKVRTGAASRPIVPLDSLRAVVGSAAHRATADTIARRAITLLRDRDGLVPLAAESVYVVRYTPDDDPAAGAAFVHELRRHRAVVRAVRVGPGTGREELERIGREARRAPRTVVYTYTRTLEGAGRIAIAGPVAQLVDSLATDARLVVVAGGNPYVLRQFPRVGSYLVTYGRGDALERAAARAIVGRAPIGGEVPVTLPGFFTRGDGLRRDPAPATGGR